MHSTAMHNECFYLICLCKMRCTNGNASMHACDTHPADPYPHISPHKLRPGAAAVPMQEPGMLNCRSMVCLVPEPALAP